MEFGARTYEWIAASRGWLMERSQTMSLSSLSRLRLRSAVLLLLAMILTSPAYSVTLLVPSQYPTIQEAPS